MKKLLLVVAGLVIAAPMSAKSDVNVSVHLGYEDDIWYEPYETHGQYRAQIEYRWVNGPWGRRVLQYRHAEFDIALGVWSFGAWSVSHYARIPVRAVRYVVTTGQCHPRYVQYRAPKKVIVHKYVSRAHPVKEVHVYRQPVKRVQYNKKQCQVPSRYERTVIQEPVRQGHVVKRSKKAHKYDPIIIQHNDRKGGRTERGKHVVTQRRIR